MLSLNLEHKVIVEFLNCRVNILHRRSIVPCSADAVFWRWGRWLTCQSYCLFLCWAICPGRLLIRLQLPCMAGPAR